MVSLRRTSDGATVRFTTNAPTIAGYRRTSVVRDATLDRSKFYFDFGSADEAFGSVTGIAWSQTCELGAAGATNFAANLIANGTFESNVTGWTVPRTGGSIAWNAANGGVLRQARSATSVDARAIQAVTTTIGVPYLLAAENSFTPIVAGTYSNPGSLGLTNAASGSTSTPTLAYSPVAFDRNGYNAHIVIPTATTEYAMLLMRAGTKSGNDATIGTCDWDNVAMFPLTA
jgi:hypothetical protein